MHSGAVWVLDKPKPVEIVLRKLSGEPAPIEVPLRAAMKLSFWIRAYAALVLDLYGGNKNAPARALGVHRTTLQRWEKKTA